MSAAVSLALLMLSELTLDIPKARFTLGNAVVEFRHLVGGWLRCVPGQPTEFRVAVGPRAIAPARAKCSNAPY